MYPFYAYLLSGARFLNKPLLKYRVHPKNTSASLLAEKADLRDRGLADERIHLAHLAHAVLMEETLNDLTNAAPARYASIAQRIIPLLNVQMSEQAKKLIRVSREDGTLAQLVNR
jgi:hypothetical protein